MALGVYGRHEVLVVADVLLLGLPPVGDHAPVAQRLRRRLNDEWRVAALRPDVDREPLGVEGIVREPRLEHEPARHLIDLHVVGIGVALAARVQDADRELAVIGFRIEEGIGELDGIDRVAFAVIMHCEIELGEEGLLVVVDAEGAQQVDVEIERVDQAQGLVLETNELHGRKLRPPAAMSELHDEGHPRCRPRGRPERPVVEAARKRASPCRVRGLELVDHLGAKLRDIRRRGGRARGSDDEADHIGDLRAVADGPEVVVRERVGVELGVARLALSRLPAGGFRNPAALEDPLRGVGARDALAQPVVVDVRKPVPGDLVDVARIGVGDLARQIVNAACNEQGWRDFRRHHLLDDAHVPIATLPPAQRAAMSYVPGPWLGRTTAVPLK